MSSLGDPVGPSTASSREGRRGDTGSPRASCSPRLKPWCRQGFLSGVRTEQAKAAGFFSFFLVIHPECVSNPEFHKVCRGIGVDMGIAVAKEAGG